MRSQGRGVVERIVGDQRSDGGRGDATQPDEFAAVIGRRVLRLDDLARLHRDIDAGSRRDDRTDGGKAHASRCGKPSHDCDLPSSDDDALQEAVGTRLVPRPCNELHHGVLVD